MADKKISALTSTTPQGTDMVPIARGSDNFRISPTDLRALFMPISLSADVTGSLALGSIASISNGTVLGNSSGSSAAPSAISTLPNGVQDNITRLGTVTTGQFANTALKVRDTGADHNVSIVPGENNTADRALSLILGNADRTLDLGPESTPTTPTWTNTIAPAPAINNGTLRARTQKHGKLTFVTFQMSFGTLTSGGGGGAGGWEFGLPSTNTTPQFMAGMLFVSYFQASTNKWFIGKGLFNGGVFAIVGENIAGTFGPAVPFTWTTSDTILMAGFYWEL